MAKKDIGKVLTTGSAKQRLLLLFENVARKQFLGDAILTDSEYNKLYQSFNSDKERLLYSNYQTHNMAVINAIQNLQGLLMEVKMRQAILRGYVLAWSNIESSELLVNTALHEIENKKERKKIAKQGALSSPLFTKTVVDEEGYIEIKIDQPGDLLSLINISAIDLQASMNKYRSWEEAILNYMDETNFTIKAYRERLELFNKQIYNKQIVWGKYYGSINTGLSRPRLDKLMSKYNVCPKEFNIDEEEYNTFKKLMF